MSVCFSPFFQRGHGHFHAFSRFQALRRFTNHTKKPRSCGADREGAQLLERVEGAVTRDLENKKKVGYVFFPEDEDVGSGVQYFLVVQIW